MTSRLDKARKYHYAIRHVLLHEWDPIGVSQFSEAQDEYDAYVGAIYKLVITRRPVHELIQSLVAGDGAHGTCRRSADD